MSIPPQRPYPWMDFPGTDMPEEEWPAWCPTCERSVDEACPACGDPPPPIPEKRS